MPPDEALESLGQGGATVLLTCPSYLAELVNTARRRGLGPGDFRLRRVTVGGEVLSPSLARAACQTLGVPQVEDSYSMTEVIPVTGRTCSQQHLHHDINIGLTELLDLRTGEPAAPGALGTVVITPYFPYRDCTPVFRFDTRDVARCLPDEALGCELAGIPATSQILGKADHLLRLGSAAVVTPRQLIDAIEALPTAPWPARYRATAHDGRLRLTLPAAAVSGYGEDAAAVTSPMLSGAWTWTWRSSATTRPPRCARPEATCAKPRSPARQHSWEREPPMTTTEPISLFQQTLTEFGVILVGVTLVTWGALFYFRRVRLDRPPIGTFNGRNIVVLLAFISALPFLYGYLPYWLITCLLVLTFSSALYIGYRPVLGAGRTWLGIGLLIGLNVWTSHHLMGTTAGWQLWWAELSILVGLGAIAVSNLYVQGGMKLRYVTWLAVGLAVYDIIFATLLPLTDETSSPVTWRTRSTRCSACGSASTTTASASATCWSTRSSSSPPTRHTARRPPGSRTA